MDQLSYDGEIYFIKEIIIKGENNNFRSPLEPYLIEHNLKRYFVQEYVNESNNENPEYVCEWILEKNELRLKDFYSRSKMLRHINQLHGLIPIGEPQYLGKNLDRAILEFQWGYMHATWFSGSIGAHSEENSNAIHIEIIQGIMIDTP